MKAGREHRVPLCGRALEILDTARTLGDCGSPIVFITERGKSLDEKRLCRLLEKHKIAAVPHGFRSSFRDWAAEETVIHARLSKWTWRMWSGTRLRRPTPARICSSAGES